MCKVTDDVGVVLFLPVFIFMLGSFLYHFWKVGVCWEHDNPSHTVGGRGYFSRIWRFFFGTGLTPVGRALWWKSGKFLLATFILMPIDYAATRLLVSNGLIEGFCTPNWF